MNELRFTLLGNGPSDKVLLPILRWILRQYLKRCPIQDEWADLGRVPHPPRKLEERIQYALDLYPCDLFFVHRDAESEIPQKRIDEINAAVEEARKNCSATFPPTVCVIPVRMTEAWLLFDPNAIRHAAGNPNGRMDVSLPNLSELESLPDPKEVLYELLRTASGLSGRHLKKFPHRELVHRVPDFIDDFSPLRSLSAFGALERDIRKVVSLL